MLLDADNHVKLCDFGFATPHTQLQLTGNTICGTVNYMPPEIVRRSGLTVQVDCWSMGVILYTMLVGRPPFSSESIPKTCQLARDTVYVIPDDVDLDAADLIRKLLVREQNNRLQLPAILAHPFFRERPKVQPQKCPFNGGSVEILANGIICLDIAGVPTILRIMGNGEDVEIATKSGSRRKMYKVNALPPKYKERYDFALKIVKQAESHKPMVIWNADSGKYVLFGNKTMGMVVGSKVIVVPEPQKQEIRAAMLGIMREVEGSKEPRWPVTVGLSF
jgi:serine/threonine protein kinase